MRAVLAGEGPLVVVESVICPTCGPRLWNSFDEFPDVRFTFPYAATFDFVRSCGPCGTCGGQCLAELTPINLDAPCTEERTLRFADGSLVTIYQVPDDQARARVEVPA